MFIHLLYSNSLNKFKIGYKLESRKIVQIISVGH
jgi:hypothetical protein